MPANRALRIRIGVQRQQRRWPVAPASTVGAAEAEDWTTALKQPPRSAFRIAGSGAISATWASLSQPVEFTTKQPASSAWWRIVTSIWSAKICPTIDPGKCAQWISSRSAIRV